MRVYSTGHECEHVHCTTCEGPESPLTVLVQANIPIDRDTLAFIIIIIMADSKQILIMHKLVNVLDGGKSKG